MIEHVSKEELEKVYMAYSYGLLSWDELVKEVCAIRKQEDVR